MRQNDALPRVEVAADSFAVTIDGELVEPAPVAEPSRLRSGTSSSEGRHEPHDTARPSRTAASPPEGTPTRRGGGRRPGGAHHGRREPGGVLPGGGCTRQGPSRPPSRQPRPSASTPASWTWPRTPALRPPALRVAARRLGRQLTRAARCHLAASRTRRAGPAVSQGAHQPVVLGLTARAAGLGPLDAAYCSRVRGGERGGDGRGAVAQPRPVRRDRCARAARVRGGPGGPGRRGGGGGWPVTDGADVLPARSAPLLEIGAEAHAALPVRLFAS